MESLKNLYLYKNKNVLLLQSPVGPFFWRLKKDLEKAGAKVYKINFNGGDWIFYPRNSINYRGTVEEWKLFLKEFLQKNNIHVVLLFNDTRIYHRIAVEVCKEMKITVGVFEFGYIRPDYITLEINGVNGLSELLNLDIQEIERFQIEEMEKYIRKPIKVGKWFSYRAFYGTIYFLAANLLRPFFPHDQYYTSLYLPDSFKKEVIPWIKNVLTRYYYPIKERKIVAKVITELKNKYFFVPLQVSNDSQITYHSSFSSIENFIEYVMYSFSKYAPSETYLIFKHHPMERGHKNYDKFIKLLSKKLKVENRILYVHEIHLPTAIKNSIGVVLINSTTGTQVLDHGKPLIVLGKAIYKKKGLVYEGSLDNFWNDAFEFKPNTELWKKFKIFLLFYSQINGNFYKRITKQSHTGIVWDNFLDYSYKVLVTYNYSYNRGGE